MRSNYKILDEMDVAVVNRALTPQEKEEVSEFIRLSKEAAAKKEKRVQALHARKSENLPKQV